MHDSQDEEGDPKASVGKEKKSNKGKTEQNKTSTNFNNEEDAEEGKSQRSANMSKRSKSINKSTVDARSASKVGDESYKYDIPESCYVSMMAKVKIEKLSSKFLLCANPFPLIEG